MNIIHNPRIWEFDVDNTLIQWDLSQFPPDAESVVIETDKGVCTVVVNRKNVNLMIKLAKVGWYIRVHSGSGVAWAEAVVKALGLDLVADEVCAKPLGRTDDMPPGEGLAYQAYRNPKTGAED